MNEYEESCVKTHLLVVDALCRDGAGQISRERVQRGRLTRQGTTS